MENEIDTPLEGGTETVAPDQNDTAPDWDYYDPDDEPDNVEAPEPETIEDDGTETDEDPDAEEAIEDEGEEEVPAPVEMLELPDGTKVERDEAVKGYLRQSDYTRKTSEVAQLRKTLDTETTKFAQITDRFIDHLSGMIPAAPEPSLALRDPNAYTRQKAQHEAAVAQVEQLVNARDETKQVQDGFSQADRQRRVQQENAQLSEKFPETASQKGRDAFFQRAAAAAQDAGFTMDELQGVDDHRLFALAHWADIGMKAHKARQEAKAKKTTPAASPAAPQKPGQRGKVNRNREAMKRLSQSGSIHDALKVDF